MREDGEPITTEQELKELLVRIRNEAFTKSAHDFMSWVQDILVEHPLFEEEKEDGDGVS